MASRFWLVLGASGGVGGAVLSRLADSVADDEVHALSRVPRVPAGLAVTWHAGDLVELDPSGIPTPTHVVSAGPLDAFSMFAAKAGWPAGTVVTALSSMSARTKSGKGHRSEQRVARQLIQAEEALMACATRHGWRLVLLRPTLIWGCGDRSITPLLALARRTGLLPLPRGATGLRQPVHAVDLAQALVASAIRPQIGAGPWPVPGGEVLPFDEMLARALAVAAPRARLLRMPDLPCRMLEMAVSHVPGRAGRLASQMRRARSNLDVGGASVWSSLGIEPRGFNPVAGSFPGLPDPAGESRS